MKKLKQFGLIAFISVSVISCLNIDDDSTNVPESGWISFVNASPGSSQLRLYEDGHPIPGNALNYGEFNNYWRVETGTKQLSVRSSSSEDMTTKALIVKLNDFYSVYAVNTPDSIELVTFLDNHQVSDNINRTVFRFMQLSYNTPEVKLKFETEDEDFGSYNFKESTDFVETKALDNKNVYLIDVETNDTLLTKKISLLGRRSYVLFSKGVLGSTNENQKLDFQLIEF